MKRIPPWAYRAALYFSLIVLSCFAVVVLALRYWLLPNIESYRADIAGMVSAAAKQRIEIGSISAGWEGLRPHLSLGGITVYDDAGNPAIRLERVENTLSWLSLLNGELRFHSFEIERPQLDVQRAADGTISVAGIALNQSGDSGFADWVLRQRSIVIHGARIEWLDQQRGAPLLELNGVDLRLENSRSHHRFGLHAIPPDLLAAPLDLRGDLVGKTVDDWNRWHGTLFAQIDFADLAAWQTWLPLPVELRRGSGAVRTWMEFQSSKVSRLTADVRLMKVQTRLAPDLPEIDLEWMRGRLGWTWLPDEFALATQNLSLVTVGGVHIEPTDFSLKLTPAQSGRPAEGWLKVNAVELSSIAAIADHLPLPAGWRGDLQKISPHGALHEVDVSWRGGSGTDDSVWQLPVEYRVRAKFSHLAMQTYGQWPAFNGVSGEISGDEASGRLLIDAHNGNLELPRLFEQPLSFDVLTGEVDWKKAQQGLELKLRKVVFANAHLAGSANGSYRSDGLLDFNGSLSRADARHVWRYLPLSVSRGTRDWLKNALVAGRSDDVRLRLRGNLADFPFADSRRGVFEVKVRGSGGVLDYAPGWPRIENISTDLLFRGKRMEIDAQQANIFGAKLSAVRVAIPDLESFDEQLEVEGNAEGETSEFLRFVSNSPLATTTEGFTDNMQVQGRGRLGLKLNVPLRRTDDTKARGEYQFISNRIVPDADSPALEEVNGRLEFSETMMRINNAQALIFGGPASVNVATAQDGSVRVALAGQANPDNWRKSASAPWLSYLHGVADWRGSVTVRKKQTDVLLESNLRGLASDLPPPFTKTAAESVPLRFEKKTDGVQQDKLLLSYGGALSAQLLRRKSSEGMAIERGAIVLGGGVALPEKRGLWVNGALPVFDVSQWRGVLNALPQGSRMSVDGIDLKFDALDVFGHRFGSMKLTGAVKNGDWQGRLAGREISGEVGWESGRKNKITARLTQVTLVPATVAKASAASSAEEADKDLPALDVTVDNFQYAGRQLGRLELSATPEGRDWLIEKLRLQNSDGSLAADGLWQGWIRQPRTQVNVKIDVNDIGKFLARFGMPEGIKGGSAKLYGPLSWAGAPQNLDYPTLSGELTLEARRGQFVKLEPGIGKLLGVLSLQSLPRRVTLDFKDIFSQGFAFETIAAHIKIARGVANTEDFVIYGPSAAVEMRGDVNLTAETQNLRVKVLPAIGESLSVAGALLGGPVTGITAFLVQKLLRNPLDKLVSYEYAVSGNWDEPVVEKIAVQSASDAENQPAQN